ncbi:hypothetical protein FD755_002039 [Muntiacus reevesi]|uniref:Metalloprotease TIKI n=1 Tax=Muntiacus reevesi TaxID=9886 RepID=A0A5J5N598_MUNRE|nr:hypothetical protein FD755_002039 [Muntiacus reevesi]
MADNWTWSPGTPFKGRSLESMDLNSFLWTIRRDPPAYLFGTIHVPYTRVWDFIPDNSKAAFQASARVYFELDLTDPYTISALASCQLLPHGENLQDVLPRELYWRLKRHLDYVKLMMPSWMTPAQRGKGLYADYLFNAIAGNWERKRPVWVMLMVNSLTETDVRSRGVPVLDLYLAQQAEKMKKSTGAVERVEEQCHPLNGLNFSQLILSALGSPVLTAHLILETGLWEASLFRGLMTGLDKAIPAKGRTYVKVSSVFVQHERSSFLALLWLQSQ